MNTVFLNVRYKTSGDLDLQLLQVSTIFKVAIHRPYYPWANKHQPIVHKQNLKAQYLYWKLLKRQIQYNACVWVSNA